MSPTNTSRMGMVPRIVSTGVHQATQARRPVDVRVMLISVWITLSESAWASKPKVYVLRSFSRSFQASMSDIRCPHCLWLSMALRTSESVASLFLLLVQRSRLPTCFILRSLNSSVASWSPLLMLIVLPVLAATLAAKDSISDVRRE